MPGSKSKQPKKSYLCFLDPALMLGAARASQEDKASQKKAASPDELGDVGLQTLEAQLSPSAINRFNNDDLVPVLVDSSDCGGVANVVKKWKGESHSLTNNTLLVRVPRKKLKDLADRDDVKYVEGSTRLKPHCNLAHVSARLIEDDVRNVPQTGQGVLVGIIDTGIDVDHPAFKKDGKTRIVNYLDQETGDEFDAAQIDAGDASGSVDTIGHGTHVAGIAAGSGEGSPNNRFVGVAHDADLAIVKTSFDSVSIAQAVRHIFNVAEDRKQACVVNLSLGGHMGGHDGSTITERVIDQLSGPGRIVVVSAGNEGGDKIHASTVMEPGADDNRWVADLDVKARNFSNGPLGFCMLQVWHQREDHISIKLRSPNGDLFEAPEEGQDQFNRSIIFVEASHQRNAYSDDQVTTFRIITLPDDNLMKGWSVIAEENTDAGGVKVGAVHAWINDLSMGVFTSNATASHLVGMPGTAFSAITVGSYATRNEWPSRSPNTAEGTTFLPAINLENISHFSSMGPTRDGQNKPEVAGPGQFLLAPLSKDASLGNTPNFTRVDGIPYTAMQGTSMSAPYVTGALALLLEKDPSIDWAEAKRRIIKSTRTDENTGVAWNARWGYGKLDVQRLLTIEPG